jgi:PAS domain S-box-containing protein
MKSDTKKKINTIETFKKKLTELGTSVKHKEQLLDEQLAESEIRYRRLFESAKDGILILDFRSGEIIDANPFIVNIIDYPFEKIIGHHLWEIGLFKNKEQSQHEFTKLKTNGYIRFEDMPIQRRDGTITEVEFISNVYIENKKKVIQCNIRDITQRRRLEKKQALTVKILSILNVKAEWEESSMQILQEIKTFTGLESVGIRLKNTNLQGSFQAIGLPDYFSQAKNYQSLKVSPKNHSEIVGIMPLLECVSGVVIAGLTESSKPYFTEKGSFFTSNVSKLLEDYKDDNGRSFKNMPCNKGGGQTVAFIPLYSGKEIIGLLQMVDNRPNALTLEMVNFFESIGNTIGIAFNRMQSEKRLKENEKGLINQNSDYVKLNHEFEVVNDVLTHNLSLIQKINNELIVAKSKAEESDLLKSAFLANMSHEIRTPLNAILGFSRLLLRPDIEQRKLVDFVEIINTSGAQLLSIINDVLDISSIESNQLIINSRPVNINKLMYELFDIYKETMKGNKVVLKSNYDKSRDGILIMTDENRIKQVMCNLLNNAIKFTSEGEIEFGYYLKQEMIVFYVKDSGIGIETKNHNLVFQRFRQVEPVGDVLYGGNGLGLSISKALAEKLGGSITLESGPGEGSIFSFTIPNIEDMKPEIKAVKVFDNEQEANLVEKTILIVEDDLYSHAYIDKLLAYKQFNLLHAWDGKEAVQQVKNHPDISLVLMDIKMPKMDGYTAMRLIKEMRPELPIVAQTAYALSHDKEDALDAGFDSYISKPIPADELFSLIDNLIG